MSQQWGDAPFNDPPANPAARLIWTLFLAAISSHWPDASDLVNNVRARSAIRDDGRFAFFALNVRGIRYRITVRQLEHDEPEPMLGDAGGGTGEGGGSP